eukprot:Lithocolla_globosa_v1_NODE_622_length_3578_cov_109.881067.p4 type:complete len:111 gc:universal NODE_622_length_3578_cov_109.881067:3158-2826(-)
MDLVSSRQCACSIFLIVVRDHNFISSLPRFLNQLKLASVVCVVSWFLMELRRDKTRFCQDGRLFLDRLVRERTWCNSLDVGKLHVRWKFRRMSSRLLDTRVNHPSSLRTA